MGQNGRIASIESMHIHFNPIALRKAKIVYNFGLSECNRVKCSSVYCQNAFGETVVIRAQYILSYEARHNYTSKVA